MRSMRALVMFLHVTTSSTRQIACVRTCDRQPEICIDPTGTPVAREYVLLASIFERAVHAYAWLASVFIVLRAIPAPTLCIAEVLSARTRSDQKGLDCGPEPINVRFLLVHVFLFQFSFSLSLLCFLY
jgi:hypothetical protein